MDVSGILNDAAQRAEDFAALKRVITDGVPAYTPQDLHPVFKNDVQDLLGMLREGGDKAILYFGDVLFQRLMNTGMDQMFDDLEDFKEWKDLVMKGDMHQARGVLMTGLVIRQTMLYEREILDLAFIKSGVAHIFAGRMFLDETKGEGFDPYVMQKKVNGFAQCVDTIRKVHLDEQHNIERIRQGIHMSLKL